MTAIPQPQHTTLAAVDASMERVQDMAPRTYIGASQIGHSCDRHLFYSFRWAAVNRMSASSLRAVQDGFAGEDVMAARLRMVEGIELHTLDPKTGEQFTVAAVSGHMSGHLDGCIFGVLEAPKTWHVWEHKQVNETKFKKLQKLIDEHGQKEALCLWDGVYFAQAIVYMGLTGMDRHFMTVGTPGGRQYTSVRTDFDSAEFEKYLARAQKIVTAAEPPLRLSEDPDYFECKWCRFKPQCHGTEAPEVNCRTCAHSTPTLAGEAQWTCGKTNRPGVIPINVQRAGCASHLYIPPMLDRIGKPVDGDETSVVYESEAGRFVNGPPPGFSSAEIRAAEHKEMLCDLRVQSLKTEFEQAQLVA